MQHTYFCRANLSRTITTLVRNPYSMLEIPSGPKYYNTRYVSLKPSALPSFDYFTNMTEVVLHDTRGQA